MCSTRSWRPRRNMYGRVMRAPSPLCLKAPCSSIVRSYKAPCSFIVAIRAFEGVTILSLCGPCTYPKATWSFWVCVTGRVGVHPNLSANSCDPSPARAVFQTASKVQETPGSLPSTLNKDLSVPSLRMVSACAASWNLLARPRHRYSGHRALHLCNVAAQRVRL